MKHAKKNNYQDDSYGEEEYLEDVRYKAIPS